MVWRLWQPHDVVQRKKWHILLYLRSQYGFHMRLDQAKNIVIHIFFSDSVPFTLLSP